MRSASPLGTAAMVITTLLAIAALSYRLSDVYTLPEIPVEHAPKLVKEWRPVGEEASGRLGSSDPSVVIVVFFDYECIHCRNLSTVLDDLRSEFPDGLAVGFRYRISQGSRSFQSASAAVCAANMGVFEGLHRGLISGWDAWSGLSWPEVGIRIDVSDPAVFGECVQTGQAMPTLRSDALAARSLGVLATPTVLVDSLLFTGSPGRRYLRSYIRRALRP